MIWFWICIFKTLQQFLASPSSLHNNHFFYFFSSDLMTSGQSNRNKGDVHIFRAYLWFKCATQDSCGQLDQYLWTPDEKGQKKDKEERGAVGGDDERRRRAKMREGTSFELWDKNYCREMQVEEGSGGKKRKRLAVLQETFKSVLMRNPTLHKFAPSHAAVK